MVERFGMLENILKSSGLDQFHSGGVVSHWDIPLRLRHNGGRSTARTGDLMPSLLGGNAEQLVALRTAVLNRHRMDNAVSDTISKTEPIMISAIRSNRETEKTSEEFGSCRSFPFQKLIIPGWMLIAA